MSTWTWQQAGLAWCVFMIIVCSIPVAADEIKRWRRQRRRQAVRLRPWMRMR